MQGGQERRGQVRLLGLGRMTLVYVVALGLVAILVTITHWIHRDATQRFQETTALIQLSGRQRMLSQRLAFLAARGAADEATRAKLAEKFQSTSSLLRDSHRQITRSTDVYPDVDRELEKQKLDTSLPAFLKRAESVFKGEADAQEGLSGAADQLLDSLNQVVSALERTQSQNNLLRVSQISWLATLLLLVAEAGLIFFPLVRYVVRSQKELQQRTEALELSNDQLQRFAYVASHDLQEPLRTVKSMSELLAEEISNDTTEDGKTMLRLVLEGAARGEQLVNDLLQYARIGGGEVCPEIVDLGEVLDEVRSDLAKRLKDTGGQIIAGELPHVWAPRTFVRQLLLNLIGNSLKFRRKGVPPKVRVEGAIHNGRCEISVDDNGMGFEQKQATKVLRPFQRLHKHSDFEGTGLGLAVVDLIVKRSGGTLVVQSFPGEGTSMSFDLPRPPLAGAA